MSGVYGSFVECFPEITRTYDMWNDKDEQWTIRAMYIPAKGESIVRKKLTAGNTALDIADDDLIFVVQKYEHMVHEGDYFRRHGSNAVMQRVVKDLGYSLAGGYHIYSVQRVGGSRPDQTDSLGVKDGTYA